MVGLVLYVTAWLVAWVPFRDLRALGAPIAWLAGSLLGIRRGQVDAALARAGLDGGGKAAGAMYASLGAGVMELLWLAGGPRRDLTHVTRFDAGSRALLDEALAAGRGAVLGASHTGNWELAAAALAQTTPLSVLVKRVSLGVFDRFMGRVRGRYGVGLLTGEGALNEARGEVLAGRVVAVLLDQVPPREEHGEWVTFLGADALTDRAAAALAASTGAPFVVTASRRDDDGTQVLHVLRVLWPPARDRRAWARAATREATAALATFVTRYPCQWLWLHRRWKRAPATPPRLVAAVPSR